MKAYLVGDKPPLSYDFVTAPPYDAVVIGSLTLSQLRYFTQPEALQALSAGMPVVLYTPGLPESPGNRALSAALSAKRRELKSWGVVFTDGGQRRVITAELARQMAQKGERPAPGAVLTPMAKEVFEQL